MPTYNKVTANGVTLIDLSQDTVTQASHIVSGYVGHLANGTQVTGTGSGGGGGGGSRTVTGTFVGDGTITVQISCSFAPDSIYVYGDLSSDPSLRGVVSITIIKDTEAVITTDSSTSSFQEVLFAASHSITGYGPSDAPHATYSNGTLTIDMVTNTSQLRFASGVTYSYELVGSATAHHEISLEFSDSTGEDIDVYYDDSWVGGLITSTEPTAYGLKTIETAALDNVTWYSRSVSWETLWDDTVDFYSDPPEYSYCWITELGDVAIPVGSIWRVTFDNVEYMLTAVYDSGTAGVGANVIGNPLYSGGTDDGSNVPFCFFQSPWGAWSGAVPDPGNTQHDVKIERQVVS